MISMSSKFLNKFPKRMPPIYTKALFSKAFFSTDYTPSYGPALMMSQASHENRLRYLFRKELVKEEKKITFEGGSRKGKELQNLILNERGFELIQGDPGSQTTTLKKSFNNELIVIEFEHHEGNNDEDDTFCFDVMISKIKKDDKEDHKEDNKDGSVSENPDFIVFTCNPYPSMHMENVRFVPTGEDSLDESFFNGPLLDVISDDMKIGLSKWLHVRGVDSQMAEFIKNESLRKQRREKVYTLNNLLTFLAPAPAVQT